MNFLASFKITGLAIVEIFLLGLCGFVLVRKRILSEEGLNGLTRLAIELTLPLFIFCQLTRHFSFHLYPNWWLFPILSLVITFVGLVLGCLVLGIDKSIAQRKEFLALCAFQNSGWLPLVLSASLLSGREKEEMLIYIFLFLLGFNLVIWSLGIYLLSSHKRKRLEFAHFFSPPVLATLFAFLVILSGLADSIPRFIFRPAKMIGDCTLPLAMIVIGGSLASISLKITKFNIRQLSEVILLKLILLPTLAFIIILKTNLPALVGLLILMEAAMPPATSLSLIARHYAKKETLINQGILFGHLLSLITIPLFLSLFFSQIMLK